jgi:hypothetical protein
LDGCPRGAFIRLIVQYWSSSSARDQLFVATFNELELRLLLASKTGFNEGGRLVGWQLLAAAQGFGGQIDQKAQAPMLLLDACSGGGVGDVFRSSAVQFLRRGSNC